MPDDTSDAMWTRQFSRLYDALSKQNVALFVGADLPQAVTGVPSRAEMARWMAERRSLSSGLSLAQVTQRLSSRGSRYDFTALLREGVDTTGKVPQPFHQRLAALVAVYRITSIITTAYDTLLESALRAAQVPYSRVVTTADLALAAPTRPTLTYLYGLVEQPTTIVVTEDDHYRLERDRDKEGVLDEVRRAFSRNLVLFIGYDLADPDFLLLWHDMLGRMGQLTVGAFAVATGLAADEARLWAERQVTVVDVEPVAFLTGLLAAPPAAPTLPSAPPVWGEPPPLVAPSPAMVDAQRRSQLLRERAIKHALLNILREKRAYYTAATAPAELILQIQDTEGEIERIEGELAAFEDA